MIRMARYTRRIAKADIWDIDSVGLVHLVDGDLTACGVRPDFRLGWHRVSDDVDCARCMSTLKYAFNKGEPL